MKHLMIACLAVAPLAVPAQSGYTVDPVLTWLDYGSTNSFVVDASRASSFALQTHFTGEGARSTSANVGLVGNPTAGDALGIYLGGSWTVYQWATVPVLYATNLSGAGTNLVIGFIAGTANGDAVAVRLNATARVFTFTNAPVAGTDVLANAAAANSATNFYNAAAVYFPAPQISISGSVVTIASGVGGAWAVTDASGVTTNNQVAYFTSTNLVVTNSHQVATAASAAAATTNLYAKLLADYYPGSLAPSYAAANVLTLVTLGSAGFSLTNSATWATNSVTTNAIAGGLKFVASNSVDQVTWFADAAKNFILPYSSTSAVGALTNWSSLGGIGYWKFAVENAAANYAIPQGLQIKAAVKAGF